MGASVHMSDVEADALIAAEAQAGEAAEAAGVAMEAADAMATAAGVAADVAPSAGNVTMEVAGAACVNQPGWDADFANRAYSCAFKTLGNAWRAGRCMASVQHVSSECGTCMGALIHCGKACIHECCYGRCSGSENCVSCSVRNCAASFIACAGIPPPGA